MHRFEQARRGRLARQMSPRPRAQSERLHLVAHPMRKRRLEELSAFGKSIMNFGLHCNLRQKSHYATSATQAPRSQMNPSTNQSWNTAKSVPAQAHDTRSAASLLISHCANSATLRKKSQSQFSCCRVCEGRMRRYAACGTPPRVQTGRLQCMRLAPIVRQRSVVLGRSGAHLACWVVIDRSSRCSCRERW